jgi:alpha-mannosidase
MKELHLICNAHLDPVWQWDWNEGATAALATFYAAVDIAEEYDYIFCHNEALLYEYIEKYDPELFARIQDMVKRANGISWAVGTYSPTVTFLRAKGSCVKLKAV